MSKYTFDVQSDPDNDDGSCSIFIDNGLGSGAEVCGKIASPKVATFIAAYLNTLQQDQIKEVWDIS
jgi:hypothetical protein